MTEQQQNEVDQFDEAIVIGTFSFYNRTGMQPQEILIHPQDFRKMKNQWVQLGPLSRSNPNQNPTPIKYRGLQVYRSTDQQVGKFKIL